MDNGILSIPMVESNRDNLGGEVVTGLLDIADLVFHVLQIGIGKNLYFIVIIIIIYLN